MPTSNKTSREQDATSLDDQSPPFTLQPQEVILGLCGEYIEPGQLVWSGGLVTLLTDLGFSTDSARVSLNRVVTRGLFERRRDGRFVYYEMTPRLKSVIEAGRRQTYFFRQQEEWDGNWTFVWYSIPDEMSVAKRRLARRLGFLGFGSIQDGAWLMPGNRHCEVASLVHELELEPCVTVLVGRLTMGLDADGPIGRIWHLENLADYYQRFVERFSRYRTRKAANGLSPKQAFIVRTRAIDAFRQLASMDPKLPNSFTRGKWKRDEAVQLFQDVTDLLKHASKTYFDATTSGGRG